MKYFEFTMWAMLLVESLVAGACLLKTVQAKFAAGKHRGRESVGDRCLKAFAQIVNVNVSDVQHTVEIARTLTSNSDDDPAAEVLSVCLKRCPTYDELTDRIQSAVMRLRDGGAIRLHAFLIKTAPMIGIAGTVVGLLIAFGSIATIDLSTGLGGLRTWLGTALGGMAAALISTLWGIAVSIMAKASLDGLHLPRLEAEFARVQQQVDALGEILSRHQIAGWGALHTTDKPVERKTNGKGYHVIPGANGRKLTCPDSV